MKSLKLIAIILLTFAALFATSFILDLPIIKQNNIRQILVYLLILVELFVGINIFIEQSKLK